jgi:hypothetical protein
MKRSYRRGGTKILNRDVSLFKKYRLILMALEYSTRLAIFCSGTSDNIVVIKIKPYEDTISIINKFPAQIDDEEYIKNKVIRGVPVMGEFYLQMKGDTDMCYYTSVFLNDEKTDAMIGVYITPACHDTDSYLTFVNIMTGKVLYHTQSPEGEHYDMYSVDGNKIIVYSKVRMFDNEGRVVTVLKYINDTLVEDASLVSKYGLPDEDHEDDAERACYEADIFREGGSLYDGRRISIEYEGDILIDGKKINHPEYDCCRISEVIKLPRDPRDRLEFKKTCQEVLGEYLIKDLTDIIALYI